MNMKPGLWEIKTKMKSAKGETTDPMAHMKEAMAKMPPAQRKQMEAMMAKNGTVFGGEGIKTCYTKESLNDDAALMNQKKGPSKCTTKILEKSSSKTKMEFSCEDGSKGTGEWNFSGNEKYNGVMKLTTAKGQTSEILHDANFISSDCGNVKPISLVRPANLKN